VLLDISASITTNNRARQLAAAGQAFPAPWVLDAKGEPTSDPNAMVSGGGSLLPVGGMDHGHKGYALALLIESLTQGLSGLGRRSQPKGMLMNVFLQVIDPDAFGGRQAFVEESSWLVDACHANPPRAGVARVRVPGDEALARRRNAELNGVPLSVQVVEGLAACLQECRLAMPDAFTTRN
jgi:L-lactate dehydrogenase